jgi:hypothetical protein
MEPMYDLLVTKFEIHDLVLRYWHDVDTRWGADAHDFFTEDGVFVSERTRLAGRAEIKSFYDWRRGRGERVARHIVNNARVTVEGEDRAVISYLMTIYAADGVPVLPVTSPNLISDVTETMVRSDGAWLIEEKRFTTLFMGDVPATVMPAEILAATRAGAKVSN